MASLRLYALGFPRVERDGHPITLNLRRALALLVYLAVTGRPQSRDGLAALLWPESDEREARARRRRTLHRLNQDLGDDVVQSEGDVLCLAPHVDWWVDSAAFQAHAAAALGSDAGAGDLESGRLADLAQAAGLYADDFLAGFALPDNA